MSDISHPFTPNIQQQLDQRCPCMSKLLAECDCQSDPNPELVEVGESIKSAMPWLENAYCLMGSKKLDKRYPDLYMAVCDTLHSLREASEHLGDEPEIPEI
jgi:hypothetical protein